MYNTSWMYYIITSSDPEAVMRLKSESRKDSLVMLFAL